MVPMFVFYFVCSTSCSSLQGNYQMSTLLALLKETISHRSISISRHHGYKIMISLLQMVFMQSNDHGAVWIHIFRLTGKKNNIPWICYERSFSEFYLSIWNQLVFNQRLQLFVSHRSRIYWFLPEETKCIFQINWSKNNWISEFHRKNPHELKCWSTFYVNYFLRYYLMMQHQHIVKRANGAHEWAHRPYQHLSAF